MAFDDGQRVETAHGAPRLEGIVERVVLDFGPGMESHGVIKALAAQALATVANYISRPFAADLTARSLFGAHHELAPAGLHAAKR